MMKKNKILKIIQVYVINFFIKFNKNINFLFYQLNFNSKNTFKMIYLIFKKKLISTF